MLLLLIIALAAIPFVIPQDKIKDFVLAKIEATSGRKVKIDKISLSFFPNFAVVAGGVEIASPDWAGKYPIFAAKNLRIAVETMPLWDKKVVIKELSVDEPAINLIKKGDLKNWQFGGESKPAKTSQSMKSADKDSEYQVIYPQTIIINSANFNYRDLIAEKTTALADFNLQLQIPQSKENVKIKTSGKFSGNKFEVDGKISNLNSLLSGKESAIIADIFYNDSKLNFNGNLTNSGGVPSLSGSINIPYIDLAELNRSQRKGENLAPTIKPIEPQQAVAEPRKTWSNVPIKTDFLKALNLDLAIAIDKMVFKSAIFYDIKSSIKLNNGNLVVTTDNFKTYGGSLKFGLNYNNNKQFAISLLGENLQAEQIIKAFADKDIISGGLDLNINLNSNDATSQATIIHTLAGNTYLHFKEGRIKGINIAAIMKKSSEQIGGETNFSDLTANFLIANGVAENHDLQLTSRLLNAKGEGKIDLPNRNIDYKIRPMISSGNVGGITVPIKIEGDLENPTYKPDVEEGVKLMIKSPEKLKENFKDIKNDLKDLKGILR